MVNSSSMMTSLKMLADSLYFTNYKILKIVLNLHLLIYKTEDLRQTWGTCPFNIYGRIVYKANKGSAYYYLLLSYKNNKTLLWEKSRISLERDWEKANLDITIEVKQYENIIKSVLRMKHHNYLKQFMVKLFRNNLYFKNVTSKFSDSGTVCNSCKEHPDNRPHFFLCKNTLK